MSSVVSIRTDSALLSQFTTLAEATGRTRSFLINQAMREFVERNPGRSPLSRRPYRKLMPAILLRLKK